MLRIFTLDDFVSLCLRQWGILPNQLFECRGILAGQACFVLLYEMILLKGVCLFFKEFDSLNFFLHLIFAYRGVVFLVVVLFLIAPVHTFFRNRDLAFLYIGIFTFWTGIVFRLHHIKIFIYIFDIIIQSFLLNIQI